MLNSRITVDVIRCLLGALLLIGIPGVVFPQKDGVSALFLETGASSAAVEDLSSNSGAEWTVDLSALMVSPAIAWSVGPNWRVGAGGGLGDDFLSTMVVGGYHYSEPGLWSYDGHDGAKDKKLFDILHAKVFARAGLSMRWQLDIGLQGSVFLHFDSSDDDPGGGASVTVYALPMYGWRRIKIGPRIAMGYFGGCDDRSEFGVKISPLIIRWDFN